MQGGRDAWGSPHTHRDLPDSRHGPARRHVVPSRAFPLLARLPTSRAGVYAVGIATPSAPRGAVAIPQPFFPEAPMRNILFAFALLLALGAATNAHALLGLFENNYRVVFDAVPDIKDDRIYLGEAVMGDITKRELKGSNVVLTVDVKKEFLGNMVDTTVFVAEGGRLKHATLGPSAAPLKEGANVLGFTDALHLNLFKAKAAMNDLGDYLRKKADELAK